MHLYIIDLSIIADRIIPPRFIGIEHLSFFVNIQATIKPSGILHHHCPLVSLYYCLQSFTITMLHVRRILYGLPKRAIGFIRSCCLLLLTLTHHNTSLQVQKPE